MNSLTTNCTVFAAAAAGVRMGSAPTGSMVIVLAVVTEHYPRDPDPETVSFWKVTNTCDTRCPQKLLVF